jgi:NAD(P)-dependent dehydrogenase (short-subunit alcohol dehydrogenase family)
MTASPPLALVTGGCRRLGAALAVRLARAGYALALNARGDAGPEPALAEVLSQTECDWRLFPADLGDASAVEALVPAVCKAFGRAPALLVNNASRFGFDTPESVTAEAMLGHYGVNCVAPALLCRALAEAGEVGALVVNILDQRIAEPNGDQLSYTLSKLALAALTPILARHFAPRLRINAIAPGLTLPTADYDAGQMARLADAMPLDRLPSTGDVADALIYLAQAQAVTGQTIYVDGGAHLCRYERDFVFLAREGE